MLMFKTLLVLALSYLTDECQLIPKDLFTCYAVEQNSSERQDYLLLAVTGPQAWNMLYSFGE